MSKDLRNEYIAEQRRKAVQMRQLWEQHHKEKWVKLDAELRERLIQILESLNLRGLDPILAAEVYEVMQRLKKDRDK